MKTLVIDVAAESGGAVTILNQFIEKFKNDKFNEYHIVVSKLDYTDESNVKFIKLPWVKKSYLHRLYFDNIYIRKLIKQRRPETVFSLQNKAVRTSGLKQEVYFQNALPISEKRFSMRESFSLWLYQNIIGGIVRRSLKRADKIYVQAPWMKRALSQKWGINERIISIMPPTIDVVASLNDNADIISSKEETIPLFYPAHAVLYKNHGVILKALRLVYANTRKKIKVVFTADKKELMKLYKKEIQADDIHIEYVGYLDRKEMEKQYKKSILVFPSYIETVGLPLKEAKQYGSTIITADCEYARDALDGYEKVYYFPSDDEKKLADLIIKTCIQCISGE